jgi:hypothetical protein
MSNLNDNPWWHSWKDLPDEDELKERVLPKRIPHQSELIPPCYCDITYVCDECKRKRRPKIMTAI